MDIFSPLALQANMQTQQLKNDPKWFKLYLEKLRRTYVTGTVFVAFLLAKRRRRFQLIKGSRSTISLNSVTLKRANSPEPEEEANVVALWNSWVLQLEYSKTTFPDEQGFYPLIVDGALNQSSEATYDLNTGTADLLGSMGLDTDNVSMFLELTDASSSLSTFSEAERQESSPSPHQSSQFLAPPERRHHRKKKPASYEFLSVRNVKGVLFMEILSAHDLPKFKNLTRTGFDMDPFVVVLFGKRTFRTSWRKHTLNPVFNERLAFEILDSEAKFDINLSILDKDSITFHDRVADITIPVTDIMEMSTNFLPEDDVVEKNENVPQRTLRSGLLRKKIKPLRILSSEEERRFIKFELPLEFSGENKIKYGEKYHPTLNIKCRFEPYSELRIQFWRHLLKQYDVNDDGNFTYLELSTFLDILGSTLSHKTVVGFFSKYGKSMETDALSVDQVVDCLEELITKKQKMRENKETADKGPGDIIKVDTCPVCEKSRLSQREDLDIITHVAICSSKDRSSAERLIKALYVLPSFATKRWYSRALINLGYGKVRLGGNNANILVQDRTTGIILEEKMSVYVRVGIRLLYRGSNAIQKKHARKYLKKLTFQQGVYYDSPKSRKDIASFAKFHNLDLSECSLPIEKYKTFNEFFFRRLVPGARPVEAEDNKNIVCSAADCRCTVYNFLSSAITIWIKGKGFTIPKLFAGKHPEVMTRFMDNCAIGIFRLAPQDYHRFHCPVDGIVGKPEFIEGEYYTVNPMAIRSHLDVFGENSRCIIPIETERFGTVVVIPVGAMMVGATVLTVKEGDEVARGDELGYFKFGGSTLLVLFQENKMLFDSDLVSNSMAGIETLVKVGMSVGHHIDEQEVHREKRDFDNQPEDVKLKIIRTITGASTEEHGDLKSLSWEAANLLLRRNVNDVSWAQMDEDDIL